MSAASEGVLEPAIFAFAEPIEERWSHPLGVTLVPGGTNFCLFSRHASSVELLLFDHVEDTLTCAKFQCFDFEGLDKYPQLLEPLLFYVLHRANTAIYDGAQAAFRGTAPAPRSNPSRSSFPR